MKKSQSKNLLEEIAESVELKFSYGNNTGSFVIFSNRRKEDWLRMNKNIKKADNTITESDTTEEH